MICSIMVVIDLSIQCLRPFFYHSSMRLSHAPYISDMNYKKRDFVSREPSMFTSQQDENF